MKQRHFEYIKNDQKYDVVVTYRHQKNIYFRYKENCFYVSAPYLTGVSYIKEGIDKYFDRLINPKIKKISHFSFEEDYVYLLGNKVQISSLFPQITNENDLNKYLFKQAEMVITEEVRKYERIMNISVPYKIKIKKTRRQFGSNSKKTHALSFQVNLIHYSLEIIDSVVVHELAHEFERNHQKKFYEIVYNYCPNYKVIQRKLKRGIHL